MIGLDDPGSPQMRSSAWSWPAVRDSAAVVVALSLGVVLIVAPILVVAS